MKKALFTNRLAEMLLLALIRLAESRPWVFKFVPAHMDYKPESHRKAKRKGISYQLDISDYQEWLIYFYCNSDSSDHVLNYLNQAVHIFDIGANIGQTSLNMFLKQKSKGLEPVIYAFEPYPRTFEKLKTHISLNKNTAIKPFNCGIGKQKGLLYMIQHSPSNSGGFRMTSDKENSVEVQVISLDEFVSENQIEAVDFLKIDVEGFELEVLKGAQQTIRRFRPVIIFEYSVENILTQQGNIPEALDELLKNNYKISTKEGISDLKAILELENQTDLICLPN